MSTSRKTSSDRGEVTPKPKSESAESHLDGHQVEMLSCDIPAELPIIPLASTVVFPQMVVNLQVVRKKNLNLIRDMNSESIIGLVVQKKSSVEVPRPRICRPSEWRHDWSTG